MRNGMFLFPVFQMTDFFGYIQSSLYLLPLCKDYGPLLRFVLLLNQSFWT